MSQQVSFQAITLPACAGKTQVVNYSLHSNQALTESKDLENESVDFTEEL